MAANIRFATEADIPVILEFIHALAAYENMEAHERRKCRSG